MKPLLENLVGLHARFNPWLQSLVLLFLRITIGCNFFMTGRGKLLHLEGTTKFFASLHIPAPGFHAVLVGSTEMVGGILLVVGLATRFASLPLVVSMVVAYLTADREGLQGIGEFVEQTPFPYLCVTLVTLAFGAGKFSLDAGIAGWWAKRNPSSGLTAP